MEAATLVPDLTDTFPETPFAKAVAWGDRCLAADELMAALEFYVHALTVDGPEDGSPLVGPDTIDQLRVQMRVATVFFALGAETRARDCLTSAAAQAERAAWRPSVRAVPADEDSPVDADWLRWERITRCEGFDEAELAQIADLLRRWGAVHAERGGDEDRRRALSFWELGDQVQRRRFPDRDGLSFDDDEEA